MAQGLALLDAAVIAMAVGIFEAQAHLWTIFLQVEQLLAVERSPTLPGTNNSNDCLIFWGAFSSLGTLFIINGIFQCVTPTKFV